MKQKGLIKCFTVCCLLFFVFADTLHAERAGFRAHINHIYDLEGRQPKHSTHAMPVEYPIDSLGLILRVNLPKRWGKSVPRSKDWKEWPYYAGFLSFDFEKLPTSETVVIIEQLTFIDLERGIKYPVKHRRLDAESMSFEDEDFVKLENNAADVRMQIGEKSRLNRFHYRFDRPNEQAKKLRLVFKAKIIAEGLEPISVEDSLDLYYRRHYPSFFESLP